MMNLLISSLLGLAFYEAIRIYRCIKQSKKVVPDIGFSRTTSKLLYVAVFIVFAATSMFIVIFFEIIDPVKAFLLGFAVPSGAHLLSGNEKLGNIEIVDDMASEVPNHKLTFSKRLKLWIDQYSA